MTSVLAVPGIERLSSADLRALEKAADAIGVPVDWLATIISFESGGTFSPSQLNRAGSGAFGLIQFLPSTAANLLGGTQAEAAAKGKAMSFSEQLERMVVPYFQSFDADFHNLQDLYLAVFYPRAMNKADDWVIGTAPGATYTQNAGLDRAGKGYITRGDVTAAITRHYNSTDARVNISGMSLGWLLFATFAGLAGVVLIQPYLPPEARLPASITNPLTSRLKKGLTLAKQKTASWAPLLPLALLGAISFGWMLIKKA